MLNLLSIPKQYGFQTFVVSGSCYIWQCGIWQQFIELKMSDNRRGFLDSEIPRKVPWKGSQKFVGHWTTMLEAMEPDSEQPGLVEDIPAHCRGIGLGDL